MSKVNWDGWYALRKKCPYSELFWSVFSRIRTEYGEILRISPYSVRMRENTDQNNSEYGPFSRSDAFQKCYYHTSLPGVYHKHLCLGKIINHFLNF